MLPFSNSTVNTTKRNSEVATYKFWDMIMLMVARQETARVLQEFESQVKGETNVGEKDDHHEQGLSTQKTFQSQVKNLVSTI